MKRLTALITTLLLFLASSSLFAQNYYVCDTGGNDNNDGRSESNPFQSYDKGMNTFNKMSGGDSVLFCRGGVFPLAKDKKLSNRNCNASSVCTVADYGDSDKEKPYIVATDRIAAFWFNDGPNYSEDGGYTIKNLILRSNRGAGVYFYNDVNDVLLENLHIEGFNVGIYLAGANGISSTANMAHDRVIIRKSVIINNSTQGLLGGCNDCLIEDNVFQNNGFDKAIFNHNIYIESSVHEQNFRNRNIIVRNNALYQSAIVNGVCSGTSFTVHGMIDNLTIENNIIREDKGAVSGYCWGISVSPGNGLDESYHNLVIRGNKLVNVGNTAIGCASCSGVIIENNIIIDDGNTLLSGITVPNKKEDSVKSKNVIIQNNQIVLNNPLGTGITVAGENAFVVDNNQIHQSESSRVDCIKKKDANVDTDTSTNTCNLHTSMTFTDKSATYSEVLMVIADEKVLAVEEGDTASTAVEDDSLANEIIARGTFLTEIERTTLTKDERKKLWRERKTMLTSAELEAFYAGKQERRELRQLRLNEKAIAEAEVVDVTTCRAYSGDTCLML